MGGKAPTGHSLRANLIWLYNYQSDIDNHSNNIWFNNTLIESKFLVPFLAADAILRLNALYYKELADFIHISNFADLALGLSKSSGN